MGCIDRSLTGEAFIDPFAPMQAFMQLENLPEASRALVEAAQA